jgi:hypothetical protein
MTISIVGIAQVSHFCKMEIFMDENCSKSMDCCNEEDEEQSCCSTEIDFYQAELSPVLSEINNFFITIKEVDVVVFGSLNTSRSSVLTTHKTWRPGFDNLYSSSSPPLTIQYSVFLI